MYLKNLSKVINIRVDSDTYVKLQDIAKKNDISVSNLIRFILDKYLIDSNIIK